MNIFKSIILFTILSAIIASCSKKDQTLKEPLPVELNNNSISPGLTLLDNATMIVRGKVVDEDNVAMSGVIVKRKSVAVGTTTLTDGTFIIIVPSPLTDTLVFKAIGYIEQEVPYSGSHPGVNLGNIIMVEIDEG